MLWRLNSLRWNLYLNYIDSELKICGIFVVRDSPKTGVRSDGKTRGFIAQSVGEVLPSAVFRSSRLQVLNDKIDTIDTSDGLYLLDLGPVGVEMIGAIQVLAAH